MSELNQCMDARCRDVGMNQCMDARCRDVGMNQCMDARCRDVGMNQCMDARCRDVGTEPVYGRLQMSPAAANIRGLNLLFDFLLGTNFADGKFLNVTLSSRKRSIPSGSGVGASKHSPAPKHSPQPQNNPPRSLKTLPCPKTLPQLCYAVSYNMLQ